MVEMGGARNVGPEGFSKECGVQRREGAGKDDLANAPRDDDPRVMATNALKRGGVRLPGKIFPVRRTAELGTGSPTGARPGEAVASRRGTLGGAPEPVNQTGRATHKGGKRW